MLSMMVGRKDKDEAWAAGEVSVAVEGEPFNFGLNGRFLELGLRSLNAEVVCIEGNSKGQPLVVKGSGDDSVKYVIMPILDLE